RFGLLLVVMLCTGCSRAPSFDILGSFFPAWLLCLAVGLLLHGRGPLAVLARSRCTRASCIDLSEPDGLVHIRALARLVSIGGNPWRLLVVERREFGLAAFSAL